MCRHSGLHFGSLKPGIALLFFRNLRDFIFKTWVFLVKMGLGQKQKSTDLTAPDCSCSILSHILRFG